jgi:hypothetical protein
MIKDWPGLSSNVSSICFTAESLGGKKRRFRDENFDMPCYSSIPRNEGTCFELLHQDLK